MLKIKFSVMRQERQMQYLRDEVAKRDDATGSSAKLRITMLIDSLHVI